MRNGLLVINSEHHVIFCSDGAARLMGLGQAEFIGAEIEELLHHAAQVHGATEFGEISAASISKTISESSDTTLILPRPGLQDLAVTAFNVQLKPGEQITAVAVSDVTDEQQEGRKWGANIAIVSHEISNLLTVIYSYTDLLLHRTSLDVTQRQWLETIRSDNHRISDLVSSLSEAAQLESTAGNFRIEPLFIGEAVGKVTTASIAAEPGHVIDVEVPGDLPIGFGSRIHLEHILKNLVENAVKYSPRGGRVLISAQYQPEKQRLIISVGDQGLGIAPEDQDRIFLIGERITRSETDNVAGTGLGLFIVKELVELMGGEVWVESELDLGSTFYFTLPATPGEVESERSQDT